MAHPYDPLTPAEIRASVQAVRNYLAKGGHAGEPVNPLFNSATNVEPPKYDVLRWQGLFSEKELAASAPKGWTPKKIVRQADVSDMSTDVY
jgi:Cu2+-containing amine oxidase